MQEKRNAAGKTPILRISSNQTALRAPRKRLAELVAFVARKEGARVAEVDLAFVAGREMAAMNRRYLNHAGSTDVLSFDLSEAGGEGIAAQIIICPDVAVRQAKALGVSPQRELVLYVVHGLLHLMGYDDVTIRGAAAMHAREDELLKEFLSRTRRQPRNAPRIARMKNESHE